MFLMLEFKVLFYSRTLCKYCCAIHSTTLHLSKDDIATSFKRQFIILTLNKTLAIQKTTPWLTSVIYAQLMVLQELQRPILCCDANVK